MSEYLVEVYVARHDPLRQPGPQELSRAADELTSEGHWVELTQSILVPDDETRFYLLRARSGQVVAEAATRAGLQWERLVEAVSDWAPTAPSANPTNKET